MKLFCLGSLALASLCVPLSAASQTLILPHIVDGGGWQSTIVLTNLTRNAATAALVFRQDQAGGGTSAWTPPFLETSSLGAVPVPAAASVFLRTPGTASALAQGWGQLTAEDSIAAYVIFTYRAAGRPDQDATSPAVAAASRILVPFDNASGNAAAIAIVNPTASAETINVTFRISSGQVITGTLPILPPQGHMAFVLPQQFSGVAQQTGLAEFYSASGNFSILALRFNATLSSTSAPAYFQSGPSVIFDPGVSYPPEYTYSYQAAEPGK